MKKKLLSLFLSVGMLISVAPTGMAAGGTAYASTQAITLNGESVELQAYALKDANGNDTNYVKLRDVAYLLNGTGAQFDLNWDGAVNMVTAQAYTVNGSEMVTPFSGNRSYQVSAAATKVNGTVVDLDAITLTDDKGGGYTYYKLRDLSGVLGFTVEWVPGTGIVLDTPETMPRVDLYALLEEMSDQHKELVETPIDNTTFMTYLVEDPATVDLLSDGEIDALLKDNSQPEMLTYEQAAADVDLLFRVFRSTYGAYYYFGAAAFDAAKAEIMAQLEGQESVAYRQFEQIVTDAFLFLRDTHTWVGSQPDETVLRYEYYYCEGQTFAKDGNGYYKYIGEEKWYFDSFSDPNVKMAPYLQDSGELCYSPVLFCIAVDKQNSTVTLKSTAGEVKKQTLTWTENEPFSERGYREPDFKFLNENGIVYISERNLERQYESGILTHFVASSVPAREAKVIIFDIRANGGGADNACKQWAEGFSGQAYTHNLLFSQRNSKLNLRYNNDVMDLYDTGTPGTYRYWCTTGSQLANDIPILVLVDDICGCAGESLLHALRSMDNVLIIGSNTGGYQLGGNAVTITLPNSGLKAFVGTSLCFNFNTDNVEFKGYEPDVWCNPADALDAAINLLVKYDLTDKTTAEALLEGIETLAPNTVDMSEYITQITPTPEPTPVLQFPEQIEQETPGVALYYFQGQPWISYPGGGTGSRGPLTMAVYLDGQRTTDFTVSDWDTAICDIEKTTDGFLLITPKTPGKTYYTVTVGDVSGQFHLQSNVWPVPFVNNC